MIIGCGSLFTPTPALVLAATSTRYWIPGNNPPIITDRMAASTVLLIWNRVSFPRHQIYRNVKWITRECKIILPVKLMTIFLVVTNLLSRICNDIFWSLIFAVYLDLCIVCVYVRIKGRTRKLKLRHAPFYLTINSECL